MAFIGASASIPAQVVLLDFLSRSIDVLKESEAITVDAAYPLRAPGDRVPDRGRSHRPRVLLPAGEQGLHGAARRAAPADRDEPRRSDVGGVRRVRHGDCGTGRAVASRVVDVNYGGSTGYGRAYRERLYGNWGVVDTTDCINAARYLVDQGEVDGDRLLIRGGSAGRLHHALRADVPRRLRGRRELLRHLGPGAVREARRHPQVRVAVRAHAGGPVPGGGGSLPGSVADPLRGPDLVSR